MKRFFSIILLFVLLFASPLATAQTLAKSTPAPSPYPLWDIPWGVSKTEFVQLAKERIGVDFVSYDEFFENLEKTSGQRYTQYKELDDDHTLAADVADLNLSVLGSPLAIISAFFNETSGTFHEISMFWEGSEGGLSNNHMITQIQSLIRNFTSTFDPILPSLHVCLIDAHFKAIGYFDLPLKNATFDALSFLKSAKQKSFFI